MDVFNDFFLVAMNRVSLAIFSAFSAARRFFPGCGLAALCY